MRARARDGNRLIRITFGNFISCRIELDRAGVALAGIAGIGDGGDFGSRERAVENLNFVDLSVEVSGRRPADDCITNRKISVVGNSHVGISERSSRYTVNIKGYSRALDCNRNMTVNTRQY